MNWPTYVVYVLCVFFIRIYKFLEYQVLRRFNPLIRIKAKEITDKLGVVMHCDDDPHDYKNMNKDGTWQDTERQKALTKYDKIIHLKVNNTAFFARMANHGSLAAGETYMEKMWDATGDVEDITQFAARVFENDMLDLYYNPWNKFLEWVELHAFNLQTVERAFQPGKAHYDLGNELFEIMLDPWMQYSCAYWKDVDNLNDAQLQKMELIARKLDLKPGMKVLDIGCGWGTFSKYLAENYQVSVVGVTIALKGAEYGRRVCAGLPIEFRVQDYRQLDEKFDRIVSVGMFEHVGFRNYREYFQVAHRCLKDDGIFLLHTIARNHTNTRRSEPWSNRYIFPNGNLPNPKDIARETKDLFVIEDWHNIGLDYAKTLYAWRENFIKGWPQIKERYGGEKFYRMWVAYLSFSRSLFLSRRLQLWQIALSKNGLQREYRAAR